MVRSASKNFQSVAVVTDPGDYAALAAELDKRGDWSLATRLDLAQKAFAATARYDGKIAMELERLKAQENEIVLSERPKFPARLISRLFAAGCAALRRKSAPERGALHSSGAVRAGMAGAKQLQGKELSYNNLVDLDAAWDLVQEFKNPAAVIVKHNNPCGVAERTTLAAAYREALACDPVSAFGGVMAFNRRLDAEQRRRCPSFLPNASWRRDTTRRAGRAGRQEKPAADGYERCRFGGRAGLQLKPIPAGCWCRMPTVTC